MKLVIWRADIVRGELILIRNRLERYDIQSGIKSSQDLLAGATWWGGPILRDLKRIIIFRDNEWFLEKPFGSLNYWVRTLQMSKIY